MTERHEEAAKVSMQDFEKEFGLGGNTPAAESDAAVSVANEEVGVDEIATETVDKGGVDTKVIERAISEDELFAGLDDNLERMEKREELDKKYAEEDAAEAAAATEKEADDADDVDDDAGDAEGEAADEGVDEAAPEGGEEDAEGSEEEPVAEAEGDEPSADATPLQEWVRKNLPDDESRADLIQTLMDEGAALSYVANGETVTEPLRDIIRKAAGYSGEAAVSQRSQAAKQAMADAAAKEAAAKQVEEQATALVENFRTKIDDPEWMSNFMVSTAPLDYLRAVHGKLEDQIREAEENPTGFATSRRLSKIETMLEQMLNGGADAGHTEEGSPASGADKSDATTEPDPAGIPDDLGFIRGQGYPAPYTKIALREVNAFLDAATAAGVEVKYEAVLESWKREGKKRPILEVAKGLISGTRRDGQKLALANKPPTKRTPGKGRGMGGKKPSGDSRSRQKAVAWDDIPNQVVASLKAAQDASELKS